MKTRVRMTAAEALATGAAIPEHHELDLSGPFDAIALASLVNHRGAPVREIVETSEGHIVGFDSSLRRVSLIGFRGMNGLATLRWTERALKPWLDVRSDWR